MKDDPIVIEVRRVRDRHAASFHYDLDGIFRDVKEKEKASGRRYVRFQPRLCDSKERSVTTSGEDRER